METRIALEKKLPDLTDGEWDLLVEDGFVEDYEIAGTSVGVDNLVKRVEKWRATRKRRTDTEGAGNLAEMAALAERASTRAEAIAALLAARASEDQDVLAFRREVLRGKLVKRGRVDAWVRRRAREGELVQRKVLGMPSESRPETVGGFPILEAYSEVLQYAVPGGRNVVNIFTTDKLERLRKLSEALAARYGWQAAQATVFVLTGAVPIVAPVKVRTTHRMPLTATSRIALDVDPTVTPQEVAKRYARARSSMMGRSRRMSNKHLRLAIFADTHQEGTWEARKQEWNRQHPDWRYQEARHFQRDATQAIKRLLTPPLRG